jgi:cytochrome bd ubiquinol oxidase subunit II
MINLNGICFFLIGILLTGYAVLDGFDLGIGTLYMFLRSNDDKNTFMQVIAPVWDGNEVWLVAGGGALFAAFPNAYASAFSGFYLAFLLVLMALIFRSIAIEFRNKESWPWWQRFWDSIFVTGSIGSTLLFGVIIGNIITGLPIDSHMNFQDSSLLRLFQPYPILVGFFVLSLFSLHGAFCLNLKTQGLLQVLVKRWARRCLFIFASLYSLITIMTFSMQFSIVKPVQTQLWPWGIVLFTVLAMGYLFYVLKKNTLFEELMAFVISASLIVSIFFLFGIGLFPKLLPSVLNPAWSLDVYNAAASQKTLWIILIIAMIGMPFVLAYTISVYWIFRGKVNA